MEIKIKIQDLKGIEIKKNLSLKSAKKSYENKHKDGSGNFGFVLITKNKDWFRIDGEYNTNKEVSGLKFSCYGEWSEEKEEIYKELEKKFKVYLENLRDLEDLKGGNKMAKIDEKKSIGNYKIRFKTSFDKKKEDSIFLNISISEDLKKLIEGIIIKENTKFDFHTGEKDTTYTRYKVKSWVFGALYSDHRDFLFVKALVEGKDFNIELNSVNRIDTIISDLKENVRRLIEIVLKYSKIDTTVSYNLRK